MKSGNLEPRGPKMGQSKSSGSEGVEDKHCRFLQGGFNPAILEGNSSTSVTVAIPRPPELLVALHGDGHRSKTCRFKVASISARFGSGRRIHLGV